MLSDFRANEIKDANTVITEISINGDYVQYDLFSDKRTWHQNQTTTGLLEVLIEEKEGPFPIRRGYPIPPKNMK